MIKRSEMEDDFYKILGVERSATLKEIQKAYRLLARKSHPDLAEEGEKDQAKVRFQKIQEAYDCLSDPEKRQMYDQFGSAYKDAGGQNPFQGFGGGGGHQQFDFNDLFGGRGGGGGGGFEDIFRQFGGGGAGPRSRGPVRGTNLEHEITVPFRTAIQGGQAHLTVQRPGGKTESITVKIPAGIEDLKKIRLSGQGDPSPNGGPAGDLMIRVKVASHPIYRRQGNNLLLTVPITLSEAALGAKIDLPTPHGTLAISIPPGSSSGKKLRLKGQGVAPLRGTAGDLIVELQVKLPESYSEASQQAIEALQDQFDQDDVRGDLDW